MSAAALQAELFGTMQHVDIDLPAQESEMDKEILRLIEECIALSEKDGVKPEFEWSSSVTDYANTI